MENLLRLAVIAAAGILGWQLMDLKMEKPMETPRLTMISNAVARQKFNCKCCGWKSSNLEHGRSRAAAHVGATGHEVIGEVVFSVKIEPKTILKP